MGLKYTITGCAQSTDGLDAHATPLNVGHIAHTDLSRIAPSQSCLVTTGLMARHHTSLDLLEDQFLFASSRFDVYRPWELNCLACCATSAVYI